MENYIWLSASHSPRDLIRFDNEPWQQRAKWQTNLRYNGRWLWQASQRLRLKFETVVHEACVFDKHGHLCQGRVSLLWKSDTAKAE